MDTMERFQTLVIRHKVWPIITSVGIRAHFLGTSYLKQEKSASSEWYMFGELLTNVQYFSPDMDQD